MMAANAFAAVSELPAALKSHPLAQVFPGADRVGAVAGAPPAAPIFKKGRLVGYVFLTSEVVASVGYSGKPVKILAGLNLEGKITGAAVYQHQEPILVLGIPDRALTDFIEQYRGMDIRRRVRLDRVGTQGEPAVAKVSGASITSLVFSDSILRSARLVARARGVISGPGPGGGGIDLDGFRQSDWPGLVQAGALGRLRLTNAQVSGAFADAKPDPARDPDKVFIDLYAGLATPAAIGQNLLGFAAYNALRQKLEPGAHALFAAAGGFYSFRGYSYRRTGVFERLQLVQGERTIRLTREMHRAVEKLSIAGAPGLREQSLFLINPATGFDGAKPWRLEVLVARDGADGKTQYAGFPLSYDLPAAYRTGGGDAKGPDPDAPLWLVQWGDGMVHIVLLAFALGGLLASLVFQDWLVQRQRLMTWVRLGFLGFVLFYLGWVTAAQLSVVNVLTFVNALLSGFRWDFFMLEPLIFILWSFVAVTLLFWGRGVFCGWLCPFGALQELVNKAAQALHVPQLSVPFVVNERVWALKYVLFLAMLALSLGPAVMAEELAELEPFKTAIVLKFARTWPFVVYALVLVLASVFVQRAFCRYLCPLGAALAIPSGNRMFAWLKRRAQCGTDCQICADVCPVQAIHPDGRINLHECIYCLDCQAIYYDDHHCPPLVKRRKRRETRRAMGQYHEQRATGGEAAT